MRGSRYFVVLNLIVCLGTLTIAAQQPPASSNDIASLQQRAATGDAVAENNLGFLYHHGQGVTQDYTQALAWYTKAADQGNAAAEINLGYLYHHGQGVTQDYTQARVWYTKAADQGNAVAENQLGYLYNYGQGVTQDYTQALAWITKAAAQGNSDAETSLGYLYEHGQGVTQDYTQALAWYQKAAAAGSQGASGNVARLQQQIANQQPTTALAKSDAGPPPAARPATIVNSLADPETRQWLLNAIQAEADSNDGHDEHKTISLEIIGNCTLKYVEETRETDPTGRWIVGWSNDRDTSIVDLAGLKNPTVDRYRTHVLIGNDANVVHTSTLMTFGSGSPHSDSDTVTTLEMAFRDKESADKAGGIFENAVASCTARPSQQGGGTLRNQQIADKIAELQADIQQHDATASQWDQNADQIASGPNCSGIPGIICTAGAAKAKANAQKERDAGNEDRSDIARLQGQLDSMPENNVPPAGQNALADSGGSGSGTSYNPDRHYSGPDSDTVQSLLNSSSGWSCPSSITQSIKWTPPIQQVCMRDYYVTAAVAAAYGAECEARLGRDQEAEQDAESMASSVKSAKSMCSNAPVVANNGPGCSTLEIVPCP